MRRAGFTVSGLVHVQVAVPVGRNVWVSKPARLSYEGGRLQKADGIDLTLAGSNGVTGILYVIKECLCRDHRRLMRLERHKIVDGILVDVQNWGEVEDSSSPSPAAETEPGALSPSVLVVSP